MEEQKFGKYIDLDAFVPPVEPSWITINKTKYDVVPEIQTGTYMRLLQMEVLQGQAANENLISIFNETIPSLPREIIEHMTSTQLSGCLAFLMKLYLKGATDPNLIRPMLNSLSRN